VRSGLPDEATSPLRGDHPLGAGDRRRARLPERGPIRPAYALGVHVTLRPAMPEDASRISQLLDQLGWVVPPEGVVAELSASPSTEVVVAELDDDVVGVVAITTRRQFQRAGNLVTIDTLVVDEAHRSRGIGERLVDVALEAASGNNAQAVEIVSALRRVEARRFYERLGFEVTANYFLRST
jgi:predicted N-acetyltransferase YhbS